MSEVYAAGRARIEEFVRPLDPDTLEQMVPACPKWTIKELVAHLTGVASDSLSAKVSELGRADWTAAQVQARRDSSIDEILDEWRTIANQLEPVLDGIHPTLAAALIGDLTTHELDLRGAIGNSEGRTGGGLDISTSFYARNFGKRLKDAGLPTVVVDAGENRWTAGREEPIGSVRGSMFELLRGLTGRRTSDEVKGLDWSIDAAPYVDVFSMYPVTEKSLNE